MALWAQIAAGAGIKPQQRSKVGRSIFVIFDKKTERM
jgi:hypothetical protein